MSAFAAILPRTARPLPHAAAGAIGAALQAVVERPASAVETGHCTLFFAPLHDEDPPAPVTHGRQVVAGTAMIEGRADLARSMGLPARAPALTIAAAARERWGRSAMEHLSGEYAIAGWDGERHTFWCARDGLGVRLAYVGEGSDAVVVSNVLEAVLACGLVPDELDDRAIVEYLACGWPRDTVRTPYRAIGILPEAHTLEIEPGGTPRLKRHWWMPSPVVRRLARGPDICEAYRDALRKAVRDRLDPARTIICLSGGLDSTAIAAIATALSERGDVRAVTSEYRRFAPGPSAEESRLASRVAERLGLPLQAIAADRCEPLDTCDGQAVPAMLLDEPAFADWQHFLRAAAMHSTIAINGEDGDALFAPPGGFELLRNQGALGVTTATLRYIVQHRARPYLGIRHEPPGEAAPVTAWLTQDARRLLDATRPPATILGCAPTALPPHPTRSQTQARLGSATMGTFGASISPESTRARLEVRLPLMDSRVLECVFAAPPIPWCQRKYLVRAAFRGALPDEVVRRRKTPVAGYYEAAVSAWRRSSIAPLPASVVNWVDPLAWHKTVRQGSTADVLHAWRGPQLAAWLRDRHEKIRRCITQATTSG